jgi:nucleoside-diphosphate-sugar epimerase
MKILVTGYKGYIGSHLFSILKRSGFNICGIDLKEGEDILNCLPDENFDYVFHFAAIPRVGYSVENPSYTMKQNVYVTSVLLEWAKKHNVKRFIFSSSSAVMGDGDGIPKSPYGLHKLMNEMECRLYSDLYGLDTVCLRYFNAYSEDQKYGGSYSTAICAWMEMIKQGAPLRMDGDGEQTRDLVHVDDIVSANIFCMKYDKNFNGAHFNVGCGESVSMNYIKNFINKHHDVEWNYAPERKGDVKHTLADISQLKKLGWEPKITIDEGLDRCFNRRIK